MIQHHDCLWSSALFSSRYVKIVYIIIISIIALITLFGVNIGLWAAIAIPNGICFADCIWKTVFYSIISSLAELVMLLIVGCCIFGE